MSVISLEGRVAVVTGSGRGLGRAYALALAEAGGRAAVEVRAVGDAAAADALVKRAVAEFGRLDGMVTNAGVLRYRVLWKMADEDFDAVVHTHLRGTFTCARAAAVQMRAQGDGGHIIVVGSPAGQRGKFSQTNYAAAKAGIAAFARTHAIGMPEDCAGLVVFLASEAADRITGQAIGIGGDRLAMWSHPAEISAAFREGGWTADQIAATWAATVGERQQTYGVELPDLELETPAR